MFKKFRFKRPFYNQHGKPAQALLKPASQHLYRIHWSLPCQMSWKKSLFLTCLILGLVVNTLPVDEKYPVHNRDNLTIPIQMQLSQKQKTFAQLFAAFLKSITNFKYFEKKMTLKHFVFSKLRTPKTGSYKCLKSPAWEETLTRNMVIVPKHCWNQHHSNFSILIYHRQVNWVGESLSYWHAKS